MRRARFLFLAAAIVLALPSAYAQTGFCTQITLPCASTGPFPGNQHWVSLPTTTSNFTRAEDFCAGSAAVTKVSQIFPIGPSSSPPQYTWDCASLTCTSGTGAPIPEAGSCTSGCFCVDNGEGFIVETSGPATLAVNQGIDENITITLAPGGTDYLISPPYHTTAQNAADILNLLPDPSGTVTLTSINTCMGTFSTYTKGGGSPFALPGVGHALYIRRQVTGGTMYSNPVAAGPAPLPSCIPAPPPGQVPTLSEWGFILLVLLLLLAGATLARGRRPSGGEAA